MSMDVPRMRLPDRHQHVMEVVCLDTWLAPEHRVRDVWKFVELASVKELEGRIKSRSGVAGAPATSPRLLLALWLYACLDGVGSAREISRLCEEHIAYRWLCGGVGVNHHTLSDFRGGMGDFLDGLLTEMIASLVEAGVVDGSTIHQDGTKVRAAAGSSSFRREATLVALRAEAAEHVARVKAQADDPALGARVRAARTRAAEERLERVDAALRTMEQLRQARAAAPADARRGAEPRASTTDADARVMKTRGGGRDAAYNVQFATDGESRAIVGVQVSQKGSDNGLSEAMRTEVQRRTGVAVRTHVTDAGYLNKATVEREEGAGVTRIMPLPTNPGGEPATACQPSDGPGVRAWRARMQTEEAKALMRERPGVAETPNGELKTYRAMGRMLVRGTSKVTGVVLLSAIVYNLTHFAEVLIGTPMKSP